MIEIRIKFRSKLHFIRDRNQACFYTPLGGKSEIIYDIFMISLLSHYDTRRLAILIILQYSVYPRIS
jgi:hypothetical protein